MDGGHGRMSYRFVKIDEDSYVNIDRIDGIFYSKRNDQSVLKIFVGGSDEPWTTSETPEEFLKKIQNPQDSFTQEEKDMLIEMLRTQCYKNKDYSDIADIRLYDEICNNIEQKIKRSPLWAN
jgi:hypothetical protein